jgi:class 3 adenylate cyclase
VLKAIQALAGHQPAAAFREEGSEKAGMSAVAIPAEADRRQLTVMFADLLVQRHFPQGLTPRTSVNSSENIRIPWPVRSPRFEGHVAKFLGDGVLAYFGWPQAHEDEAERAVRAAMKLTAAVATLKTTTGETLAARVGIATGLVVVGEIMGEKEARERAVVGETPNLAARLQGTRRTRRRSYFRAGEGIAESRFDAQHPASMTPLIGAGFSSHEC